MVSSLEVLTMSRTIHALAAVGVFLAAHPAWSQIPNPNQNQRNDSPAAGTSVRGKIVRVEGQDKIIVQTSDNREVTLMSNPNTRYVIDGRAARFGDLRNGAVVSATYNLDNGRYLVSSVQVGDAPGAAQPAQPGGIDERRVRGRVVSVNPATNQIVVRSTDGNQVTLFVQKNGRLLRNGQTIGFADVQVGNTVNAQYLERDGRWWVDEVTVTTDNAAIEPAPQVTPPQGNPPLNQPAATSIRGRIVRVDGQDRIVVQTTDNREVILISNPNTRYVVDGRAARFTDLRTGVNISASYNINNGRYLVSSVQVGDAPDTAPPAGNNDRRFRGRIVSVNAATNQIVAKSQDGAQVTLFVQKNGRFLRNGQAIRFADLQVGTAIEAQYLERDGHWWVDEVTVVTDTSANDPPAGDGTQVQGVVVRVVGQNQVIIRTPDNKEMTIDLVPQTVYTFNNQPGQFRDIQPGQDVRVQYNTRERRSIASRIFGMRR